MRTIGIDRRRLLAGGLALGALAVAGCKSRLSGLFTSADTHPPDYPTVQATEHFGRLVAERTGGRHGVKVYASGQLGNERDTLEITTFGGLDLNRINMAPVNSIEPMTLPFSLPFIFTSVEHMRRVTDSALGDEVLASLEPHGLIGLCFYDSGSRHFYNTRRAIRTPQDMRGLKLRVPNSDLYLAMVNALGANAVPMPFDEVYQSLAQGVVDGAENNWPSFETARHYEVARYFSLTNHLLTPEVLVMARTTWDGLSPQEQAIVRQSAKDSVPYMRTLWDAKVESAKKTIYAAGALVNEVDTDAFARLMRPVWDQFITTPRQRAMVDRIVSMGDPA